MDHSASAAGHRVHQSVSISLIIARYYRPALDEAAVAVFFRSGLYQKFSRLSKALSEAAFSLILKSVLVQLAK